MLSDAMYMLKLDIEVRWSIAKDEVVSAKSIVALLSSGYKWRMSIPDCRRPLYHYDLDTMSSSSREKLSIGGRYLHGRTRRPLTLRYIGLLDTDTTWYGVEYDEPSHGRGHSGEYNGVLFFKTRRPGSGAFVKVAPGALIPGPTFVEALEERYGPVIPDTSIVEASIVEQLDKVSLGTSGIIVEAPMMSKVKAKVGRLENLREVGLEGEWVGSRGKTDLVAIKERLKGW